MNGLKLNQKILVDSSCYFNDEILKLEKTRVRDAEKTSRGVVVTMTDGHWGACPTRNMTDVVATEEDIEKIFNSHVLPNIERKGLTIGQGKGKTILVVEDKNYERGGAILIEYLTFQETKETLAEGVYDVYYVSSFRGGYSMKVFNKKLGINIFDNIDDAKKYFTERVKYSL